MSFSGLPLQRLLAATLLHLFLLPPVLLCPRLTVRGCAAQVRRSVRTHKSLVKVQALVRGHIVRRQAAITLRCMNALVRVQARARANAVRKSATGREVQHRLEAGGFRQPDGPEKKRTDVRTAWPRQILGWQLIWGKKKTCARDVNSRHCFADSFCNFPCKGL